MVVESPHVIPLGVSPALPQAGDVNSYLAVVRDERFWLVDCAGSPIQRLTMAGLDPLAVEGVFITHFHPDHVYGLPAFILGLYLLQGDRTWPRSIPVCARQEALTKVRTMMGLFESQGWLSDVPLDYRVISPVIGASVARTDTFAITAAPTQHSVPSMAVRFALPASEHVLVYSGDTAPCDAVATLAADASLLIHEATGEGYGHSDALGAGEVAAAAGASQLALIHYDRAPEARARIQSRAEKGFGRAVILLEDLKSYAW